MCATNTRPSSRARSSARDLLEGRRVGQHVVVDAGERGDAGGHAHARIHQALPLEVDRAAGRADHRDVDDAMQAGRAAGRFHVDERDRRIGRDVQLRSIHVVLSSVYLSKACSDLSRPMPDCLKPPNGTVMSSAS